MSKHPKLNPKAQAGNRLPLIIGITIFGFVVFFGVISLGMARGSRDFAGTLLTGENIQLADYRGQVVLLNFWATWCPPCRAEMPAIQAAYEAYQAEGFVVLAINNAETPPTIQNFLTSFSLNLPIVLDTDARLQRTFGIRSYPTSIFIDANGFIYASHTGMLSPLQIENYIEAGFSQAAVANPS